MGTKKYEDKQCEACGKQYRASRAWSKYCSKECGQALTEIYNQLLSEVRIPVKEAAKKIAKMRVRNNDV